jgi:hypothetical protein
MAIIIFQPQGSDTPHQEGTVQVQAPKAGVWGGPEYSISGYPITVTGVETGVINAAYSGRFDDPRYYTGDTAS